MHRSSEPGSGETHRLLGAGVPDKSRYRLPVHLLLKRDAALQHRLKPSVFIEDRHRALKDRPLDAGEFGTEVTASLAWAGCCHPALKDCLGLFELLVGADDRKDFAGGVALGECFPQAPVCVDLRAERRQGVVAGIAVGEQRAVGIERDRQLEGEVPPGAACGTAIETGREGATLDAERLDHAESLGLGR